MYKCITCGPGVPRSQRELSDPLELKLIDGCGHTAGALDHGATSPASLLLFLIEHHDNGNPVLTVKKVEHRETKPLCQELVACMEGLCEGIQLSTSELMLLEVSECRLR